MCALFRVLYLHKRILSNPTRHVVLRPSAAVAPKAILTQAQMGQLLDSIDIHARLGLRDRALFELLYSSGLRVSEAARLEVADVDVAAREVLVRQGKWGKDRLVPVSQVAVSFLKLYLQVWGRSGGRLFGGQWPRDRLKRGGDQPPLQDFASPGGPVSRGALGPFHPPFPGHAPVGERS